MVTLIIFNANYKRHITAICFVPFTFAKIFIGLKQLLLFFALLFLSQHVPAQLKDTAVVKTDTLAPAVQSVNIYQAAIKQLLQQNNYLNSKGTPVAMPVKFKQQATGGIFFYLLLLLVLLLALLRFFYARYFTTLFRVFFNTSLRQSQLTDQLLQAKLPSLLFNLFFILSAGTYVYFLLQYYHVVPNIKYWLFWAGSIGATAVIYFTKYSSLKFTGWITGYSQTTSTYVFVIFLINKILGIVLLPFTILMAFGGANVAVAAALVSLLFTGLLLLMRFLRSYGLLQNQLKINRFHFFLYLAGVEIIPLLVIYKGVVILLQKNL